MCLSTAYLNKKEEECVCARYVSLIEVEGEEITLTDIMGQKTTVHGTIRSVDLTGAVVMINVAE